MGWYDRIARRLHLPRSFGSVASEVAEGLANGTIVTGREGMSEDTGGPEPDAAAAQPAMTTASRARSASAGDAPHSPAPAGDGRGV
jgi:hypothetical protein